MIGEMDKLIGGQFSSASYKSGGTGDCGVPNGFHPNLPRFPQPPQATSRAWSSMMAHQFGTAAPFANQNFYQNRGDYMATQMFQPISDALRGQLGSGVSMQSNTGTAFYPRTCSAMDSLQSNGDAGMGLAKPPPYPNINMLQPSVNNMNEVQNRPFPTLQPTTAGDTSLSSNMFPAPGSAQASVSGDGVELQSQPFSPAGSTQSGTSTRTDASQHQVPSTDEPMILGTTDAGIFSSCATTTDDSSQVGAGGHFTTTQEQTESASRPGQSRMDSDIQTETYPVVGDGTDGWRTADPGTSMGETKQNVPLRLYLPEEVKHEDMQVYDTLSGRNDIIFGRKAVIRVQGALFRETRLEATIDVDGKNGQEEPFVIIKKQNIIGKYNQMEQVAIHRKKGKGTMKRKPMNMKVAFYRVNTNGVAKLHVEAVYKTPTHEGTAMCVAEPKEGGLFMPEIFFLWTAHGAQGCPREQFMSDHRYTGEPGSREVLRATVIAHLLNQVSGQNQQENLLDVSNRFALNSVPALALLKNYSVRVTAEGIKSSKNDLFGLWKTWPLPSVIKRDWPTNWIIAINRHTDFNKVHSLASALNATVEQRDVTQLNNEAVSEEFGHQDTTIGDLFPPEVNDMLRAEMKALEMRDRKITYLGAGQ